MVAQDFGPGFWLRILAQAMPVWQMPQVRRGQTDMFIQTQDTPNPATLKFIPGVPVMDSGTADYPAADSAANSPLARRLFQVEGVKGVFLGGDFVAVTKEETLDWFALKPSILAGIMEHYASGMPVVEKSETSADAVDEDEDEIVTQIKQLLDTRGWWRYCFRGIRRRCCNVADAGCLPGMPKLDRNPENGDREYASALHPRCA